jgi:hypothetical protein
VKRHIAGLNGEARYEQDLLEGVFLVRVESASYRWHPQKPFFSIRFSILEPREFASRPVSGRLYSTAKALWRLNWFLRDFGYDTDLLGREEVDEKSMVGLRGIVRTVRKTFAGHAYLDLDSFAASAEWEAISSDRHPTHSNRQEGPTP